MAEDISENPPIYKRQLYLYLVENIKILKNKNHIRILVI